MYTHVLLADGPTTQKMHSPRRVPYPNQVLQKPKGKLDCANLCLTTQTPPRYVVLVFVRVKTFVCGNE